ncbi:MAG: M20/M25/M40 family metallo-hydrolase [Candidatus Aminicenantia bacterium]
MSEVNINRLLEIFEKILKIDGPSLKERKVADYIKSFLSRFPVEVKEDGAFQVLNGNCGNLIISPRKPTRKSKLAFFAHLDTIEPTFGINLILSNGKISSDGRTILGADDRAGVVVILYCIEHIYENNFEIPDFRVIFTVAEELGMFGAKALEVKEIENRFGLTLDSSLDPGFVVNESVGSAVFEINVIGKSSHAGVSPEKGVNSIQISSLAISKIRQGWVDDETTVNIGYIKGGSEVNVVPEKVEIKGEIRSFSYDKIVENLNFIEKVFREEAEKAGGLIEIKWYMDFDSFKIENSKFMDFLREGFNRNGMNMILTKYRGGSDANILNSRGIPTLNLGIGAKNPHSKEEFIEIESLKRISSLILWLLEKEKFSKI